MDKKKNVSFLLASPAEGLKAVCDLRIYKPISYALELTKKRERYSDLRNYVLVGRG